jgi:hypothetical protein
MEYDENINTVEEEKGLVRFQVLTAASMGCCGVCILVEIYRYFRGAFC